MCRSLACSSTKIGSVKTIRRRFARAREDLHLVCDVLAFALSRVCAVSRVFGRLGFKLLSVPIAREVSSVFAGGRDPGSVPRSYTGLSRSQ